jgi:Concanavalin A-like lectin/glucanases superfamily
MPASYKVNLGTVGANGTDGDTIRAANTKLNGLLNVAVAYASQTCGCDSNLASGGGTDDTAAIQAAITAVAGGEFIQDGVSLISDALVNNTNHTAALMVPPNTKITFLPGCGWFLKAGSNCTVLSNTGLTGLIGAIPDQNIHIEAHGIAINQNRANQSKLERGGVGNSWSYGVWFGNVKNLRIDGLWIQDSVTFCFVLSNGSTIRLNNCRNYQSLQTAGDNTDGLHMYGPLDDIVVENFWNNGVDDTLACNSNEGVASYLGAPSAFGIFRFPQSGDGSITNATFRRTFFDGAWSGFRVYAVSDVPGSSPSVDNIRVIESRGSIGNADWSESVSRIGENGCEIGLLQISDWKVEQVNTSNGIHVCTLPGAGACQLLRLENIDPSTTVEIGTVVAVDGDYFTPQQTLKPKVEAYFGFERLLYDRTGNGFTLVNHAGVTQTAGLVSAQAANFVATSSQYFSVNLSGSPVGLLGFANGTIAVWIKCASPPASVEALFDNRATDASNGQLFSIDSSGHLGFTCMSAENPSGQSADGSINVCDGFIHHVAVTFTTSTVIFYVDGVADGSPTTLSPNYSTVTPAQTKIGADASLLVFFNGTIDEMYLSIATLTPSQIAELANGAIWPFAGFN